METTPGHATQDRRTFLPEPGHDPAGGREPATPAERIALTIALLNRGLDLMDGFARTSLAGSTRGAFRGRHHPQPERDAPEPADRV